MGRVVLVTGVSQELGGRLATRLAADPEVSRVIGVDVTPPRRDLRTVRFVRADIRNPVIAKVIAGEDVDTVVHASVRPSSSGGSSSSLKEQNVIGTMQLLAACQRAPGVERLVVKSSAAVYGSSSRDPAMFTEDLSARSAPRAGYAKDVVEVEGYVRGFARRRPDVAVTTLRLANTIGPTVRSPLTAYLRLPAIPKPVGFDARLQLLHYDDVLACLHHAAITGPPGTYNVAGDGVLMLSQMIRRLGRPSLPMPGFVMGSLGSALKPTGLTPQGFSPEQIRFLTYGRGMDTTRMRSMFGFSPSYSTDAAFDDFARAVNPGIVSRHPIVAVEEIVAAALEPGRG